MNVLLAADGDLQGSDVAVLVGADGEPSQVPSGGRVHVEMHSKALLHDLLVGLLGQYLVELHHLIAYGFAVGAKHHDSEVDVQAPAFVDVLHRKRIAVDQELDASL